MKVNLVVASGVHQGKAIPVAGPQFLIGRDPTCNLRPASQAVSKQHCAILVADGRVILRDFGSTNGTFLNDEQVSGEVELKPGDRVKIGPLDFAMDITGSRTDATPLPDALRSVGGSNPAAAALKQAVKPNATPAPQPAAPPQPIPKPAASADDPDQIAAMLLGMDDDSTNPQPVPDGSTIMEMPAVNADGTPAAPKPGEKKKSISAGEMSNAASDILRKYMRRPK